MPRRLVLVLILTLSVSVPRSDFARAGDLPGGDPRAEGFVPEALEKIKPVLEEAVAARKVSGVATLVARRGRVVHLAAVGRRDVEADMPMEASTLFRLASMSKPITCAGVMVLVEEGKIGLDDPVAKFLPEFGSMTVAVREPSGATVAVPAQRPVTIRHLLTHTSGLSYRFSGHPLVGPFYAEAGIVDGLAEAQGTIGDNAKRLARLPLCFQPGSGWEYGLSDDVLGRVIEVVSGRTFDQFLRERLFTPLKMDDTYFLVPPAKRNRLAALYTPAEDNTIRRMPTAPLQLGTLYFSANVPTFDTGTYYSGGAGLTSTITDYARFLQMILNKGELDGVRVLKAATVEAMTSNQVGDLTIPAWGFGDGYGFGFGVIREASRDKDRAGAGALAWAGYFHTYFWVDVKHKMIGIIMAQLAPARDIHIGSDFKHLTYEALVD
jgi:CubicO group peptidase (beta-lactamase class C family)